MAIFRLKPKNDFIFGRLFGEKESKESLIALLNAILRQDVQESIVDLKVIENKQLKKLIFDEKTGSLDIRADLKSGEQVDIEMQLANPGHMVKRTEFPKFERAKKDKNNPLHRWLMFMDEKLPEEELKELMAMDPIIEKTEEKLEMLSSDEFVRELAEARERARRDWESSIEEGVAKGKAEGKAESKKEIALRLLQKGMDISFVAEVTGLSAEEVRSLELADKSVE